jgi:hypothetical protein
MNGWENTGQVTSTSHRFNLYVQELLRRKSSLATCFLRPDENDKRLPHRAPGAAHDRERDHLLDALDAFSSSKRSSRGRWIIGRAVIVLPHLRTVGYYPSPIALHGADSVHTGRSQPSQFAPKQFHCYSLPIRRRY